MSVTWTRACQGCGTQGRYESHLCEACQRAIEDNTRRVQSASIKPRSK